MEGPNLKTVLITGADGFVGRNLVAHLQSNRDIRVLSYNIHNTNHDLIAYLGQADFVFHLAGVNRPQQESEFGIGNADLTGQVVNILQRLGKKTPVVLSSSTQAALDNPYGRSKKQAEDYIFAYAQQTGASVYVYRLPGLFGKWSRPNYNSVISTFCHNISHDLPIHISAPDHLLTLAYIDDVIAAFLANLVGQGYLNLDGFHYVPQTFQITLQSLANVIRSFRNCRDTAIVPDMRDPLIKRLYTTYLSYLATDSFSYGAEVKTDNRGWLFELVKSPHIGQVFVSQTKPGVTRGGHYHHTKVEKFVVIRGQAVIRFRRIDAYEVIEYPVSDKKIEIVDIPPGYTHEITNIGDTDLITLFWANEIFDPENSDTYYMKV